MIGLYLFFCGRILSSPTITAHLYFVVVHMMARVEPLTYKVYLGFVGVTFRHPMVLWLFVTGWETHPLRLWHIYILWLFI